MNTQTQNHNSFAVVVSPSGGLPSLQNQNSNDYWVMQGLGYEILETGNKKHCEQYLEELMSQIIDVDYFNA